ncbi:unnamed protein product [Choristocarpus tenellus]
MWQDDLRSGPEGLYICGVTGIQCEGAWEEGLLTRRASRVVVEVEGKKADELIEEGVNIKTRRGSHKGKDKVKRTARKSKANVSGNYKGEDEDAGLKRLKIRVRDNGLLPTFWCRCVCDIHKSGDFTVHNSPTAFREGEEGKDEEKSEQGAAADKLVEVVSEESHRTLEVTLHKVEHGEELECATNATVAGEGISGPIGFFLMRPNVSDISEDVRRFPPGGCIALFQLDKCLKQRDKINSSPSLLLPFSFAKAGSRDSKGEVGGEYEVCGGERQEQSQTIVQDNNSSAMVQQGKKGEVDSNRCVVVSCIEDLGNPAEKRVGVGARVGEVKGLITPALFLPNNLSHGLTCQGSDSLFDKQSIDEPGGNAEVPSAASVVSRAETVSGVCVGDGDDGAVSNCVALPIEETKVEGQGEMINSGCFTVSIDYHLFVDQEVLHRITSEELRDAGTVGGTNQAPWQVKIPIICCRGWFSIVRVLHHQAAQPVDPQGVCSGEGEDLDINGVQNAIKTSSTPSTEGARKASVDVIEQPRHDKWQCAGFIVQVGSMVTELTCPCAHDEQKMIETVDRDQYVSQGTEDSSAEDSSADKCFCGLGSWHSVALTVDSHRQEACISIDGKIFPISSPPSLPTTPLSAESLPKRDGCVEVGGVGNEASDKDGVPWGQWAGLAVKNLAIYNRGLAAKQLASVTGLYRKWRREQVEGEESKRHWDVNTGVESTSVIEWKDVEATETVPGTCEVTKVRRKTWRGEACFSRIVLPKVCVTEEGQWVLVIRDASHDASPNEGSLATAEEIEVIPSIQGETINIVAE